MVAAFPTIAVIGASGLIGQALADALINDGMRVYSIARGFTAAQASALGSGATVCPVADLDAASLTRLIADTDADLIINCLGVLQDGPRGRTRQVHQDALLRLLQAIAAQRKPVLLVHLSIPGREADDATPFSRTKRDGDRSIAASGLPYVILRPGFVIAAAAYGGSALVRALAALPLRSPAFADRPFAATAINDLIETVRVVIWRWQAGERAWSIDWDLTEPSPATVAAVIDAFRKHFGGPAPIVAIPPWLMWVGAAAGDLAAHLGWSPPVRTTALREMLRGVSGDPRRWITESGIVPMSLDAAISQVPATVQERWFGRLFLLKPMILVMLVAFWLVSGLNALTVARGAAAAVFTVHGIRADVAQALTVLGSLADIAVSACIAFRSTCSAGLLAGIGITLLYMVGAR